MKTLATLAAALVLATGTAQAASFNAGNSDADMPAVPVTAQSPVQVKAAHVLSSKELARRGLDGDAMLTVSDFSTPGPHSTQIR